MMGTTATITTPQDREIRGKPSERGHGPVQHQWEDSTLRRRVAAC